MKTNERPKPFGLLFQPVDLRTRGFADYPSDAIYDPKTQRSNGLDHVQMSTSTWATTTTTGNDRGRPTGTDSDAARDD